MKQSRENNPDRLESLAVCDDAMLEEYLETGSICKNTLRRTIAERKVFPCWFGSALKAEGITELLDGIREYSISPEYPEKFGIRKSSGQRYIRSPGIRRGTG